MKPRVGRLVIARDERAVVLIFLDPGFRQSRRWKREAEAAITPLHSNHHFDNKYIRLRQC